MTRPPRVLFYVLHLLGVGHVHRAIQLTKAMLREGLDVDIVYGGVPVEGADFGVASVFHLPPIEVTDASYSTYIDGDGEPLGEQWMTRRQTALLDHFETLQPDLILFEAFPFGRRIVRQEILTLIQAAEVRQPKPVIVSSIRDILQEKRKPGRAEETARWVSDHFDHVLVHSDPDLVTLEATFPLADQIRNRVNYSGFVIKERQTVGHLPPAVDVLVSAGGGAFGSALMSAALEAAQIDPQRRHWHLVHGQNASAETVTRLSTVRLDQVTVSRHVSPLAAHMKSAKVSVSQCGYNTAMDALGARQQNGCGIVFVPHDLNNQTEQLRRAELLAERGHCVCLRESICTPHALLEAVAQAAAL
ncbi:MAG: glycosyltransferase, partial [Pseudomonadota bacterium]